MSKVVVICMRWLIWYCMDLLMNQKKNAHNSLNMRRTSDMLGLTSESISSIFLSVSVIFGFSLKILKSKSSFSFIILLSSNCSEWSFSLILKGKYEVNKRNKVTPTLHTSHFDEYFLCINIYGAIYCKVPANVIKEMIFYSPSSLIALANPKSPSLSISFFIRIFAGFISRCTTFLDSRYAQASTICFEKSMIWPRFYSNLWLTIYS